MTKIADDKIAFNIIQTDDGVMALHDGHIPSRRAVGPVNADKTTPPVPTWTENGTRWAHWGDNDLLPTSMREKVEQVPMAGRAIEKRVQFMQGEGIVWYYQDDLQKNGADAEPVYLPEVQDWMEANRILTEWWPAQCADFCLPFNCFSEMILSLDRTKVTGLYHVPAELSRLSKANTSNQGDFLVYSMHFPYETAENDLNRVAMPLYKWYDHAAFLEGLRGRKFGWHTRFPTPGMIYYARPWWLGLFKENGWMDVSAGVPKIVRAMQKNQVSLKYLILFPEDYFIFRNPEWNSYDPAKRQEIIDKKQAEINSYLSGEENAGKSLMSIFKQHEISGAQFGKIEIIAIDDKAKQGTWVPDSSAADWQIVAGFGLDPSQIGLAPEGGSMGAGSGSDKMQSFNQHITLNTPDQRLVLEPLNWIAKYNKWGGSRRLVCMVKHTSLTTQDKERSGLNPQRGGDNPSEE